MTVVVASAIPVAAIPTPAPLRVTLNDLVGMWVTVSGDCTQGQHLLSANGKYKVWCFDSISEGEWSLRDGNQIIVRLNPKRPALTGPGKHSPAPAWPGPEKNQEFCLAAGSVRRDGTQPRLPPGPAFAGTGGFPAGPGTGMVPQQRTDC
jgi:hypothetical protein